MENLPVLQTKLHVSMDLLNTKHKHHSDERLSRKHRQVFNQCRRRASAQRRVTHRALTATDQLPAVQFLHAELPVRSEYLPALQSVHSSCPVLPVYLPWLRTGAMSLVSLYAKVECMHSPVRVYHSPRVPFTRGACR
jgi:hypothetical protein